MNARHETRRCWGILMAVRWNDRHWLRTVASDQRYHVDPTAEAAILQAA